MNDNADGGARRRIATLAACIAMALVAACASHQTDDADAHREQRQRPVRG